MPIPHDCWLLCERCGDCIDVADNEVGDGVHCAACGYGMVVDAVPQADDVPKEVSHGQP
jgi:DNA-directed RNA polymerase subunit RPC12/RpoP